MDSVVGIVILNYNSAADTINCIQSVLTKNTYSDIRIVLVDNNSRQPERDILLSFISGYPLLKIDEKTNVLSEGFKLPLFSYLQMSENVGYARGNNAGLRLLYADDVVEYIMILNSDVLFVDDIIPNLVAECNKKQDVAFLSPILYKKNKVDIDYNCARLNHNNWEIILSFFFWFFDIFGILSRMENNRQILKKAPELLNSDLINVDLPSGSCLFIRKEVMRKIGGFDSNTFLYFEENILFKKVSQLGLKNYVLANIKAIHVGASSTSKSSNSFVLISCVNSACYYLRTYGDMSFLQTVCLYFARIFIRIKVFLIKKLKN